MDHYKLSQVCSSDTKSRKLAGWYVEVIVNVTEEEISEERLSHDVLGLSIFSTFF